MKKQDLCVCRRNSLACKSALHPSFLSFFKPASMPKLKHAKAGVKRFEDLLRSARGKKVYLEKSGSDFYGIITCRYGTFIICLSPLEESKFLQFVADLEKIYERERFVRRLSASKKMEVFNKILILYKYDLLPLWLAGNEKKLKKELYHRIKEVLEK